ncbi:hypothetical protein BO86DRAFT_35324 [Aspergillus japonicus CBS 114.51]|uniref:NACHT domain-containing protein n=1 Tax=Aspergillus japonicus CBS 114.51 TaxID=1448312 RepID=A0A8T8X6M5_ASPJA|nr:hypothetical protein BO86DRAFT_35324 [Aspergillus japonicus CBS 114.51]RAH83827.1 hypothetical protein BO86DRAFT_35324 [Aspergillus japonicus CBS 114.51]
MTPDRRTRNLSSLSSQGDQDFWRCSISAYAANDSRQFVGTAENVNFYGNTTQLLEDSHLPCVKDARFNSIADSEESPYCLENTRVQILEGIDHWANDRDGPCILWMSGLAGTGKSTIARTVARKYDDEHRLGASFFFSVLHSDTKRTTSFVTTIARQLADADPALRDEIKDSVSQRKDISSYSLEDQWRRLVLEPLSKIKPEPGRLPYILVIDALDECETSGGIATILRLLAQTRILESGKLRIFLTSRPDTRIDTKFDDIPQERRQCFKLHNIDAEIVSHDIRAFLAHRFNTIAKNHQQGIDWPGSDTIELLTQKADGLFIWAATACKFVSSDSRFSRQRLIQLLDDSISIDDPKSELDKVYLTVLRSTVSERHTAEEKVFIYNIVRLILGTMAVLVSPLPVIGLGALYQSEPRSSGVRRPEYKTISNLDIYLNLRHLSAIVDLPEDDHLPPRLHHPTLREFILDEVRCTEQAFHVDKRQTHLTLAGCCVNIMSQSWACCPSGRGIFDLDNPAIAVTDVSRGQLEQWLPAAVRYACLYWVHHLQQSGAIIHKNDSFDLFLRKHLLHWLEALIWMRRLSDGVRAIASLESMTVNPSVDAYIRDAKRFTLSSRSTIEPYPLQIYLSGLVFTPAQSTVRLLFEKESLHWMHRMPSISSNWSPLLQSLSGRVWSSRALAFSTCGKILASAAIRGAGKIVEVWDPVTGELLQAFDLPDLAVFVGFLGKEERLVVVWGGGTNRDHHIQQRDPWTGECLQKSSVPAGNGIFGAITMSEAGELLAFMVDSRGIRVWNVLCGCCIRWLTGHTSEIIHVVVSKDGSVLASTTVDGAIYVWDTYKAQCLQVIQSRHQSALFKPALSKDGNILAVISDDGMLQLWQPTTGVLLQISKVQSAPKHGLSSDGQALDISKDGKSLASVSYGQIQLWDIETGRCCQTINMGVAECAGAALSPNGSMLATCARVSVRLWALKAGEVMEPPNVIRTRNLREVRFSPHGRLLAVLSVDLQLYIWDTLTGKCLGDLGHIRDEMREFELWEVLQTLLPDPKLQYCIDLAKEDEDDPAEEPPVNLAALCFTDDEKFLVSRSGPDARLWDILSKTCVLAVDLNKSTASSSVSAKKDLHTLVRTGVELLTSLEDPRPKLTLEDNEWILAGAQRLLRLPPEYTNLEGAAAFENIIAIAYSAANVLIFHFRSELL